MHIVRKKTINYINNILNNQNKSKIIENSIYDWIIDYYKKIYTNFNIEILDHENEYKLKSKCIISNLTNIKDQIISNKLTYKLKDIAFKTHIELNPIKWKNHIEKKNLAIKRANTAQQATTDQFRCTKCKTNKTLYYTLQIRGADEPETAFITCVNCDNKWRQNG